jgi:hypothetical protein
MAASAFCYGLLVITNNDKQVREIYVFAGVLVLEPAVSVFRCHRHPGKFATRFRSGAITGVRTAELIGGAPVAMPTVFGAWWVGVDRSSREARASKSAGE